MYKKVIEETLYYKCETLQCLMTASDFWLQSHKHNYCVVNRFGFPLLLVFVSQIENSFAQMFYYVINYRVTVLCHHVIVTQF